MYATQALRFTTVAILVFSLMPMMGQEVDHVYLKTGSVIRGKILEIEPSEHVKIEDLCGNIWFYEISQVAKVTSEPYPSELKFNKSSLKFDTGFVNITSIGFLAGSPQNAQVAPLSLQMVNGWRNSLGLFTGAGIGIEFLNTNYMPLFLDLRYDLLGKDVVPYILARGGYAFPLGSDQEDYDITYTYSGGPMVSLGIGLKIKSRNHFAWDIGVMYRYQKTSYQEMYEWNNQEYSYTDVYNRIEIRLGFYID
jgi:hypothetical protein